MEFDNKAPKWDAQGTEPSADIQANGFRAGYKPPAAFFNYLFHKISACITELQNKLIGTNGEIDTINKNNRLKTYISYAEIGLTIGEETIEGIMANLPDNACLFVTVGADGANIYPVAYGTLYVMKKNASRAYFEFLEKTSSRRYIGVYDNTMATPWSGWLKITTKDELDEHVNSKENPHKVTTTQIGAATAADHLVKSFVYFSDIGVNAGSETIETIATNMPDDAILYATVSNTNAAIYPANYGVLHVEKKDSTRVFFTFLEKTSARRYFGVYDGTMTEKWSGWERFVTLIELNEHAKHTENPHKVTKEQVGLGNVPNVATNDQTPTYSDTNTLATLKSGEKLNVALQKIKCAITNLINHIDTHKIITYVSFPDIGISNGSETIESIATKMPENSELVVSIGTDNNTEIYPTTFGVLRVIKKNTSRTIFRFYAKSTTKVYYGFYDDSTTTKWYGWATSLIAGDVVDNLESTATNLPLSAKQGKKLADNLANLSNYNLLINGDFQVWQRGETFIYTNKTTQYTADRWLCYLDSNNAISRSSAKNTLVITKNTASQVALRQRVEVTEASKTRLIGQYVTLSFKIYVSAPITFSYRIGTTDTKTQECESAGSYVIQTTKLLTSEEFNENYLDVLVFNNTDASNVQISFQWVKLEVGSVATPFIPRLYAEELALCHRYFQKLGGSIGIGSAVSTSLWLNIKLSSVLRAKPTVTIVGTLSAEVNSVIALDVTSASANSQWGNSVMISMNVTGGSFSTKGLCVIVGAKTTDSYMTLDAELY